MESSPRSGKLPGRRGGGGSKITTAAVITPSGTRRTTGTGEQVNELFERWQQHGDRVAREALVARFMPLARSLARRYDRSSEPYDDLLQVAALGLLKALDRYDPSRGTTFASFAIPTILGEMRRYFRDSGWSLHVPRGDKERALKVRDAQEAFANSHGHAPTVAQLSQYLELGEEQVIDAMLAIQAYESLSLDAPRPGAEDEAITYGDSIGEEDGRYELIELDATLVAVLDNLPAREREILRMRFIEGLTQTQIATRVGVSQMQVSRLLRRSLDQLRRLTREADASVS